jgi:glycosyltransferase involved in cell wall biosynthesis
MKILIDDGGRFNRFSGYGQLSRGIISALSFAGYECLILPEKRIFRDEIGVDVTKLPRVSIYNNDLSYDVVFRISPPAKTGFDGPSILYSQNGLTDLPQEWRDCLSSHQKVIVSSEFDRDVFENYHDQIFVCPQVVNNYLFKEVDRYRSEREKYFQLIYVGSFSYRKGVDLLFSVMSDVASILREQPLGLSIFAPEGLENSESSLNFLLKWARKSPTNLVFNVVNKEVSPRWMARIYNQHDALITLSRGEGWGMPLYEALLSGKPVVAPDSTAMGECLPHAGVIRVPAEPMPVDGVKDEFGQSFFKTYGGQGIRFFEPDYCAAVDAVLDLVSNWEHYRQRSKSARKSILEEYSTKRQAELLKNAIEA